MDVPLFQVVEIKGENVEESLGLQIQVRPLRMASDNQIRLCT